MKKIVQVGYIGLGRRGYSMLKNLLQMPDVKIKMICDLKQENIDLALSSFEDYQAEKPLITMDYHDILSDPEIDAVFIMTGWGPHVQLSKEAMLAGKYTGVEVGCAYTLEQCFEVLETYEKTGTPLMMLENCCYGRLEMMALNMERQGLLGEVVHCKGGYHHELCSCELLHKNRESGEIEFDHYRLSEYVHRNCHQYPTHDFGPISKLLRINRGNRVMTLASFASKAKGLAGYVKDRIPSDDPLYQTEFKQGDIVTTVMTCANGETVTLELDTTLPRPYYSRDFTVRGTKGCVMEERRVAFVEGMEEPVENNLESFYEKYDHPLFAEYSKLDAKGDHEGIDWLVLRAFLESVKKGTQTPIDIYDTCLWMSIAPLSEMSIAKGGAVVDVPDFTRGTWFHREPLAKGKYCLDEVVNDPSTPIFPNAR